MANKKTKKQNIGFEFSIIDPSSERKTLRMSRLALTLGLSCAAILIVLLIHCIIAFTPIRTTIPGYPDAHAQKTAIANAIKIDSLERVLSRWDIYALNLSRVLRGETTFNRDSVSILSGPSFLSDKSEKELEESDSLLRESVLEAEQFRLSSGAGKSLPAEGRIFFTPLKGLVSASFDKYAHPAVDITAKSGSVVSAIADGTVIYSGYDEELEYVLIIQHDDNLISLYGKCFRILKGSSDAVKAGTPIALIGGDSQSATGHLHFALWQDGEALDPSKYITF